MIKKANDRPTFMTDMEKCMNKLEEKGFTDQYKVENDVLHCLTNGQTYQAEDVVAINFYRFEGLSNPDDMSILYAIETNDGRKGTLVDAFGLYADQQIGEFMQNVETHKKVKGEHVY